METNVPKDSLFRRRLRMMDRLFENGFYKLDINKKEMPKRWNLYKKILKVKDEPIDISNRTSRALIAVDYHIIRNHLEKNLEEKTKLREERTKLCKEKENLEGDKKKIEKIEVKIKEIDKKISELDWVYYIKIHGAVHKVVLSPEHGHVGNVRLLFGSADGNYSYYSYKDIAERLKKALKIKDESERELIEIAFATILLEFLKGGPKSLSIKWDDKKSKYRYKIKINNKEKNFLFIEPFHNFLMGVCYLVCVKEISRRMASEKYYANNSSHYGKDLPFSIPIFEALKLVIVGKKSLTDFITHDAPYGVFTGDSITKFDEDRLKKTKDKFKKVKTAYFTLSYKSKLASDKRLLKAAMKEYNEISNGVLNQDTKEEIKKASELKDHDIESQFCHSDDEDTGKPRIKNKFFNDSDSD